MILWFNEIGKDHIATVGGKGANLGEMARSSFPVPPGFCVGTEVYRNHICKLEPLIKTLSSHIRNESMKELEEISGSIRKRIEEARMPENAEQAIREAYRKLAGIGTPLVSVRSSATAEDLPASRRHFFPYAEKKRCFIMSNNAGLPSGRRAQLHTGKRTDSTMKRWRFVL